DRGTAAGLAAATRVMLGFGLAALDANNDGALDLVQANGHIDDYRPKLPFMMPAQLILSDGAGEFVDVSAGAGPPRPDPPAARGRAIGHDLHPPPAPAPPPPPHHPPLPPPHQP